MVFVGLISYSAYLWHQPLYALSRMQGFAEHGWPAYAVLIAVTFALAFTPVAFLSLVMIDFARASTARSSASGGTWAAMRRASSP